MSYPPPLSLIEPDATVCPPEIEGLPISPQVNPTGHEDAATDPVSPGASIPPVTTKRPVANMSRVRVTLVLNNQFLFCPEVICTSLLKSNRRQSRRTRHRKFLSNSDVVRICNPNLRLTRRGSDKSAVADLTPAM